VSFLLCFDSVSWANKNDRQPVKKFVPFLKQVNEGDQVLFTQKRAIIGDDGDGGIFIMLLFIFILLKHKGQVATYSADVYNVKSRLYCTCKESNKVHVKLK